MHKFVTFVKKNLQMNIRKIKKYCTYHNLLIVQDLWQGHYQILSIVFLKDFIELNVNRDMIIKYVRLIELNISFETVSLNTQILRMIWKNTSICVVTKIDNNSLMKIRGMIFLIHTNLLIATIKSLIYCFL